MEDKVLLHDDDAERYVIAGILCFEECFHIVSDRIKPCLFVNRKYARIASAVIEIYRGGGSANIVNVGEYLISHPDVDNPEVFELADIIQYSVRSFFEDSFNIVESLYVRRRYFSLGAKMMEFGTNPTFSIEDIQKEISGVLEEGTDKGQKIKTLRDANRELMERVDRNYQGTSDTMIPTGFKEIDDKGGLQTGDFDVIAAESSMGKTSLLTCITVNAASQGVPCMLFSMEMMSNQIAARIASPKAKISSGIIQYKRLSDWQMNDLSHAIRQTDDLPIYFDDESTISIDSIIASIRRYVRRYKIKLIGIDYLQILGTTGGASNHEQFLGSVARRLKNLAKELQVCIVALSQLARNVTDPKPTLSRVRASGQIVEAADTVIMIWCPSEFGKGYDDYTAVPTHNTAEIIVGKGRNIGTFTFIVGFDKEITSFYNYEGDAVKTGEFHYDSLKDGKIDLRNEAKQSELPF